MRLHGIVPPRGGEKVTMSPLFEGRFGRLFRRLPPLAGPEGDAELRAHLQPLADQMVEPGPRSGWGGSGEDFDNERIPAGWTYFGQFLDHDITFDPISSLDQTNDPDALHDFRTPRYDLDSVYGSGPADEPFQYAKDDPDRLLVGTTEGGEPDLPRNSEGVAVIGDPRNDENVIVSQIHLLFLRLHNKFLEQVRDEPTIVPRDAFLEAQRRTRWLYQWIVVNQYLPLVVGQQMLDTMLVVDDEGVPDIKLRYYKARNRPYMPVEFSVAAFRFGHSMIRGIYNLNDVVRDLPIFLPGDDVGPLDDARGFRRLPDAWQLDWPQFFGGPGVTPQPSRNIDSKLVAALSDLPGPGGDTLALRNLLRGYRLQLPSGQDVARLVKAPRVFSGAELGTDLDPTPLWFYVLKESELTTDGEHLGFVGGTIVGEVLLGLLNADTQSYVNQDPTWTPPIPDADGDGTITMSDVIAFATS